MVVIHTHSSLPVLVVVWMAHCPRSLMGLVVLTTEHFHMTMVRSSALVAERTAHCHHSYGSLVVAVDLMADIHQTAT
jgi:hypothetical protein